jgi:DNA-binding SARP family transcriptional activator
LFELFPYGLAIGDRDGHILQLNHKARQVLLLEDSKATGGGWSCCELICDRLGSILGTGCLSQRALQASGQLPEVRIDLAHERLRTAAWVTASALDDNRSFVLFHLRPGRPDDRRRRTREVWHGDGAENPVELQVTTLGRFRVESGGGPLNGEWLQQRAGQLLKLLVCERRRAVASDQIAEAIWPGAGTDEGRNRLRFHVHALRERIEPDRSRRCAARFVIARRGGYQFDTTGVWIDADEFEREACAGLAVLAQGNAAAALPHLRKASSLYAGEFMAEDPYAEWALEERDRLRDLAARVLRAEVEQLLDAEQMEAAALPARRLADLEPYDGEAQKLFIEVSLRRGRRSEAVRRFDFYRNRMRRAFDQEPDFDLREFDHLTALPSGRRP